MEGVYVDCDMKKEIVSDHFSPFYFQATENSICLDLLAADVNKFHYGVKLVRGAYMEQERDLAIEKG